MQNPFLIKSWIRTAYFLSWIAAAGIQFFVLFEFYNFSLLVAIIDSLISTVLFCFAGLSYWYVVRYNSNVQISKWQLVLNHGFSLLVFIGTLGVISFGLSSLFFLSSEDFLSNYQNSIYFKFLFFLILYFFLALAYYIQILILEMLEQQQHQQQLHQMLQEAELIALKAQINPHFLFNSLNSASALSLIQPQKAHEMIVKLAEYFRYSLTKSSSSTVEIQEELANGQLFLEIEKIRFAEKLQIEFDVLDDNFSLKIPAMILQPIYENAVKHGLHESLEPVLIKTTISLFNDYTEISISNNFCNKSTKQGTNKGLKLVAERLRLFYKSESIMFIKKQDSIFEVLFRFPHFVEEKY